jgi:hypothetical protein
MSEDERRLRQPPPQRRWWFGDGWSYPVLVGVDNDRDCADIGDKRTHRDPTTIEFRGLLKKVV